MNQLKADMLEAMDKPHQYDMQSNIDELASRIVEQQEREQLTQIVNQIAGHEVSPDQVDIINKACLAMIAQMRLNNEAKKPSTAKERVVAEIAELKERNEKLYKFITTNDTFDTLEPYVQDNLKLQHRQVEAVIDTLSRRLDWM